MDFKKSCLSSSLNSNYTRSENWYGLKRPGLKTGVENYIFLSEIGSGFGEAGDTRPQKILKNPGVEKCFIKGEALRRLRTNCSQNTFEENTKNFENRLIERGYPVLIESTSLS